MAAKLARERATDNLLDNILPDVNFVDVLTESLTCTSCKGILKRPMQISCGHRCCAKCVEELKNNGNNGEAVCPSDQEPIEYSFPDVSALTEVMHQLCFCLRSNSGCNWQGPLLDLEKHLRSCEYRYDLPCGWGNVGCDFIGGKKDIAEHTEKELIMHNALYSTYLFDYWDKSNQGRASMDMVMERSSKLDESLKDMAKSLEEAKESLNKMSLSGLTTMSIQEWRASMDEKIRSIKVEQQRLQTSEATKIIERINRQHAKLNEVLGFKPDLERLMTEKTKLEEKLEYIEKTAKQQHSQLSDTDLKIRLFQAATFNGEYIWKLDNLKTRMVETSTKKVNELYTPPLYTDRFGYKFCAKVLLYGDQSDRTEGLSTVDHMALYIVIMKGDYDEILKFPFPYKIKITLKNLSGKADQDITHTLIPDDKINFQQPFETMNPAIGFPRFCSHDELHSQGFVKDDAMFIEITAEK